MKKKQVNKEQFIFKKEYKKSFAFLKDSRYFIYIAILLFFIFVALGFFFEDLINIFFKGLFNINLSERILNYIEDLLLRTEGMSGIQLVGFIFVNNLQSSLTGLIFGAIFGIFPLIAIVSNGYLLGFVAMLSVKSEGIGILWRILPHGIFELPAVFISLGFGLRIGDYLMRKSQSFFRSFSYLILCFFSSAIIFTIIYLLFQFISLIVKGGTLSFDAPSVMSSTFMFFIFLTIFTICLFLGIFILEKQDKRKVKDLLIKSLKVFLLFVFPLLILAAIIEGILIVFTG
ncbi:MAG: stage II sporulation protein M [archaeon]